MYILRLYTLPLFLLLNLNVYSQRERLYFDLSRYACQAGDSISMKGYLMLGSYPSTKSTNVYVQIYDLENRVISYMFPVLHGQCIGQIIIPDTIPTGSYFLAAYTRQQLGLDSSEAFSVPIKVYNPARPGRVADYQQILTPSTSISGKIKGIRWVTTVSRDSINCLVRQEDSSSTSRHLRLSLPVNKGIDYNVALKLSGFMSEAYVQLPLNTTEDHTMLFLYEDSVLIARQYLHLKTNEEKVILNPVTTDTSLFGLNSWELTIPDSAKFYTSITVSDADLPNTSPGNILQLENSYTDDLTGGNRPADTSYITLSGKVLREGSFKGNEQLTLVGVYDTSYAFMKSVNISPDNSFKIDSLLFFNNIDLYFQLSGRRVPVNERKQTQLELRSPTLPALDPSIFQTVWQQVMPSVPMADTISSPQKPYAHGFDKAKTLTSVEVKARRNVREELDEIYTHGPFAEPALYVYDLRNETEYDPSIFLYLDRKTGRLHCNMTRDSLKDDMGHPVRYFVNEIEYEPYMANLINTEKVAYVKILESDFLSNRRPEITLITDTMKGKGLHVPEQKTPINICIYTHKKNEQLSDMRGELTGMNRIHIKGFDNIGQFQPNKEILFFDPTQSGNRFLIEFRNPGGVKNFRVRMEGFSYNGKFVHFETVVSPGTNVATNVSTVVKSPPH
ncbi:MAG: hypothetical protein J0H74_22450 [Chitinophagaceae bacterium]|nr:hypothetical protein [Chitinophagaceae bacterium]